MWYNQRFTGKFVTIPILFTDMMTMSGIFCINAILYGFSTLWILGLDNVFVKIKKHFYFFVRPIAHNRVVLLPLPSTWAMTFHCLETDNLFISILMIVKKKLLMFWYIRWCVSNFQKRRKWEKSMESWY